MKNNKPNLRRVLIFSSQNCDIKVSLKCEKIRKYKLTNIQKRQLLITPALPIARQKLQDYFERYSELYLKIDVYYSMISRGTSKDILLKSGWEAKLHVHRHLMFCAV